jgi:hypothetical protein
MSKTEKGSRSTVSPIFPRPVFESWIFSHLPSHRGEGRFLGDIPEKVRDKFSDFTQMLHYRTRARVLPKPCNCGFFGD